MELLMFYEVINPISVLILRHVGSLGCIPLGSVVMNRSQGFTTAATRASAAKKRQLHPILSL
jgi:hypothetical protein